MIDHLLQWLTDARILAMVTITPTVSAATLSLWARQIVLNANTLDEGDRGIILPILDELDDLRPQRNALIHGSWKACGNGAALVTSTRIDRPEAIKHELVTLGDLDHLITRIAELTTELTVLSEFYKFSEAIERERPKLRRPEK